MATPRGKKKIPNFNEESNYRNTGVPLILDTSAINEEGMYENLSETIIPRLNEEYVNLSENMASNNNNNNLGKTRRRSRATTKNLPLIIDIESPIIYNNKGASSHRRPNYAFTINEEKGRRGRKHSKSLTRRRRKNSKSTTRRNNTNKVKID